MVRGRYSLGSGAVADSACTMMLVTRQPPASLMANAVALQTVVDQTQALHALKSNGVRIDLADLAFLSPYPTSKLKRFGDYPTNLMPEAMPITTTLPV